MCDARTRASSARTGASVTPDIGSTVPVNKRLRRAHLFEREKSLLASVPALLHAAERQLDAAAGAVAVDEHLAAANGLRYALLPSAVLRPHGGKQAIVGTVRELDRIRFVIERKGA